MKRLWIATALLAFNGCLAGTGCVQEMDTALMDMREQAAANEVLYANACQKFADAFVQVVNQKHEFQQYLIEVEGEEWVAKHTDNGIVQATPEDFDAMLAKRDERLQTLQKSRQENGQGISNFRQMVNERLSFSNAVLGKEKDAQKARESLAASIDGAVKVLGGFAGAAVIAIPVLAP
jgi:hypothetical protein